MFSVMEKVHDTIAWYQKKIGSYDKQLWEQSVEQKVLKGIQQAPRRVVRPKTELIDVDLVRGSTFTKAKPQVPWTYITINTFSRVVLFPFHYKWWIQQTSMVFWIFLMVLYTLQIATIGVFFNNVGGELTQDMIPPNNELQEQSLTEVMIPFLLMVLLGLIHSQTVLTHLKPPVSKRDAWRLKRTLSQVSNGDVIGALPAGLSTDVLPLSQSRSSLKSHQESRPLRTKERRVRLKSNAHRPSRRREHLGRLSQDSESAYNTHEASDSILDRTSSVEHDSNVSDHKASNSSGCDNKSRHVSGSDVKLTIAKLIGVKDVNATDLSACTLKNSDKYAADANSNIKHEKNSWFFNFSSRRADIFDTMRESQESDLPNETNSEDEKAMKVTVSKKRSSRSFSSDNDEDDNKETIVNSISLVKVIPTNGIIDRSANIPLIQISEPKDSVIIEKTDSDLKSVENSVLVMNASEIVHNDVVVAKSHLQTKVLPDSIPKKTNDETSSQGFGVLSSSQLELSSVTAPNSAVKRNTNGTTLVQFNKDLVQAKEISPQNSRECTPTHNPSDCLLKAKRALREGNPCQHADSETDSDVESSTKIVRSVIRRRSPLQDATGEICESCLRNRRVGSVAREAKNTGAVSSSEGEDGGHSSACSRGSRCIIRNMASSEEFGDLLQSDVDYSSESSGSEPHISGQGEPDQESDLELPNVPLGHPGIVTANNIHATNLLATSTALSHPTDKVTCIIWERNECKKVELTALDIGWAIIETVDKIPESSDYIFIGLSFSVVMALMPFFFEAYHSKEFPSMISWDILYVLWEWSTNNPWRNMLIHINAAIQRFCLSAIFFFLLSVADRTFKQRLLYAKHFCYLTSSRRAKKFDLPHLRLNKVRNIRAWLSLRSYLKRRGPQRSVDVIVSSSFLITLSMLILMSLQLLRDSDTYLNYFINWELLVWCMALGVYLLRFMTLGLRINKKYRNLSVLITEQINLYLQMEQKPHKKEELLVAHNVLKLAESLLKEVESPFKISGISANPLILNVTKVVVLSAFSAVLTELLGFKLKLYKIKLKS